MVTSLAGANNVLPCEFAAFAARVNVVDSHIPRFVTAVLTRVVVTREYFVARHLPPLERSPDHVDQSNHVRSVKNIGDGVNVLTGILN